MLSIRRTCPLGRPAPPCAGRPLSGIALVSAARIRELPPEAKPQRGADGDRQPYARTVGHVSTQRTGDSRRATPTLPTSGHRQPPLGHSSKTASSALGTESASHRVWHRAFGCQPPPTLRVGCVLVAAEASRDSNTRCPSAASRSPPHRRVVPPQPRQCLSYCRTQATDRETTKSFSCLTGSASSLRWRAELCRMKSPGRSSENASRVAQMFEDCEASVRGN